MASPFLAVPQSDWLLSNSFAFAIRDAFPVSPGHALIIPRREIASWFDASREEQLAMIELADGVRTLLDQSAHPPDGYNLGINSGLAAGQTVMHLHLHVIPRYRGDVADPRGGVRWVLPQRAAYWHA